APARSPRRGAPAHANGGSAGRVPRGRVPWGYCGSSDGGRDCSMGQFSKRHKRSNRSGTRWSLEPGRPASGPIRPRSPPAVAVRRHDLELLVEAVVVLDADLFVVVSGAVAHALQVVLHDVVVLPAVPDAPAQLPVAVVEVEELRMLLLRLLDGEVHVAAEGAALIGAAGTAATAVGQAASERHRRRGGGG